MMKMTRMLVVAASLAALPIAGAMAQGGGGGGSGSSGGGESGGSGVIPHTGPGGQRSATSPTQGTPSASEPAVRGANPSVSTPSGVRPSNTPATGAGAPANPR